MNRVHFNCASCSTNVNNFFKNNIIGKNMARYSASTVCLLAALAIIFVLHMVSRDPSSSLVSAGGYGDKGHVHINVWRGPSKGYYKKKFAPWGYYAKLPADESPKHYKHYAS